MSSLCPSHPDPNNARELDATAQALLDHLGLPLVYPLCGEEAVTGAPTEEVEPSFIGEGVFELPNVTIHDSTVNDDLISSKFFVNQQQQPPPPIIGSISLLELHDNSISELLLTATTMSAPTIAMMELWLRFFAVFLSPLCIAWMIHQEITAATTRKKDATKPAGGVGDKTICVYIVGLASSAVLFTDTLYVYEYGRWFGLSLFVLSSIMAIRCSGSMDEEKIKEKKSKGGKNVLPLRRKSLFQFAISMFIVTTTVVFLRSDGGHAMEAALRRFLSLTSSMNSSTYAEEHATTTTYNPLEHLPHPGIDLPTIDPGLYYSSSNPFISAIVSHWPRKSYTYNVENGATPYLVNGDQRTGIPFLVNKIEEQEYVRVWTRNRFDGEYLALDIAFPINEQGNFVHDLDKPVYLVLHGLNGGSHEEYVKDLVKRRISEGSTVVVLIARGMMDTEMVGWNVFHGARTGDIDIAARAMRRGLKSLAEANQRPQRQILAGVGYSMGAIIISNYVARSGTHCALDAAMAVSGGLDMRQQLNFKRSMRLWQPMLTFGLREDILIGKYARYYKKRLTEKQFLSLLRVTSISALDVEAIVSYNSFDSLLHYYSEMSAMGDRDPEFELLGSSVIDSGNSSSWGRIADVSVPFAVLQSLDDPLVGWRTVGTNNPQSLADSGTGNVMLVLTSGGGHVGWPLGYNPKKHKWKWMNDAARDFVNAVDLARGVTK
ncbi:hypothetical protein ACHAXR_005510 [Thalassiosira sp. AJA248-18]